MHTRHFCLLRVYTVAAIFCLSIIGLVPTKSYAKPITINGDYCEFGTVTFDARFEGGALAACRERRKGDYILAIRPEGTPINPSPWYAFDVTSTDKRKITVTLDYGDYKHRYSPDTWTKEEGWRLFDGKVHLKSKGALAAFKLDLGEARSLRVAAQPLITAEDATQWMRTIADARDDVIFSVLGQSAQGRPIHALETGSERDDWLLIIGRQHPPETTGAVAMRTFMERLLADDPLAVRFRSQFGIFSVPMLNPDGVAAGNWRFESSGVDLNRDWGPFAKPESRLIRDAVNARIASGKSLVVGLDFHSTNKDVLYTQPDDSTEYGWFAKVWHEGINQRLAAERPNESPIPRNPSHNPDLPTFKTWMNVTYSLPGITVEFGDETKPDRLRHVGRVAAEEVMKTLLAGDTIESENE